MEIGVGRPAQPPFARSQDGYRKPDRTRVERASARIPGLQLCQAELARFDLPDTAALRELLETSEHAFLALKQRLPAADFPHARADVLGLIGDRLAYLRHLLATGQTIPLSTNQLKSIWSRMVLRLKRIGRRWSIPGALHMLTACLVYTLHPTRYAEAEAALQGEHLPQVSELVKKSPIGLQATRNFLFSKGQSKRFGLFGRFFHRLSVLIASLETVWAS